MMESWYRLVDVLLPFAWTEPLFMKNALLAVLLITPLCGLMGPLIVGNRMAFFADAIGHSTLTGLGAAVLLGFDAPLPAVMIFSALFAVAVAVIRRLTAESTDTVIGAVAAVSVALGIVILSRGGGFAKYSRYLIGDLLSVAPGDLALLAGALAVIALFWAFLLNRLVLIGVSPALARSRGVRAFAVEVVFLVAVSQLVAVAITWVGILVVNALLVLPAATARNVAGNLARFHLISIIVAMTSGLIGLALSYHWDSSAGATIVLAAFACYAATGMTSAWSRHSIR